MSDAEHMSRKELLQQNRFEKMLYAFKMDKVNYDKAKDLLDQM